MTKLNKKHRMLKDLLDKGLAYINHMRKDKKYKEEYKVKVGLVDQMLALTEVVELYEDDECNIPVTRDYLLSRDTDWLIDTYEAMIGIANDNIFPEE